MSNNSKSLGSMNRLTFTVKTSMMNVAVKRYDSTGRSHHSVLTDLVVPTFASPFRLCCH